MTKHWIETVATALAPKQISARLRPMQWLVSVALFGSLAATAIGAPSWLAVILAVGLALSMAVFISTFVCMQLLAKRKQTTAKR